MYLKESSKLPSEDTEKVNEVQTEAATKTKPKRGRRPKIAEGEASKDKDQQHQVLFVLGQN